MLNSCTNAQEKETPETTIPPAETVQNTFKSKLFEKWNANKNERDVYFEFTPEKEAFMRGEISYSYPFLSSAKEIQDKAKKEIYLVVFDKGEGVYFQNFLDNIAAYDYLEAINVNNINLTSSQVETLINGLMNKAYFKKLILKDCGLQSLPPSISKLSQLETLVLSFNQLSSLPNEFTNLKRLKYLELRNNTSFNRLPEQLGDLSSLEYLGLAGSKITSFPTSINGCKNLMKLVANSSQLMTIPKEIGDCTWLLDVNLGYNKIEIIPKEIGNLSRLTRLDLSGNKIENLPEEFSKLKNIKFCVLSHNNFKTFPTAVLGLDKVMNLWLHGNNFTTIPVAVANLPSITHLLINEEKINPSDIVEIKKKNPNLRVIHEK